jgi:hypothetical protein
MAKAPAPLDPETWVYVVAVLERARRHGLDPVEELNRRNLILSPAAERRVRLEALEFIQNELQSWRPTEVLRTKFRPTHTATPTDMYTAIIDFIGLHITNVKNVPS